MASDWNMFVKKIFHEGKKNNEAYSFKQALTDASRRKGEMGMMGSMSNKTAKKSRSKRRGRKISRKNKKSKK